MERLVVLGGAGLAASLLAEGLIDELQLTLCPQLLGGPHAWLPLGAAIQFGDWVLQEHRRLKGEELLLRYCRVLAKP
jgi:5-amino-6-(5-phosphoribosylamino)uracil reductase